MANQREHSLCARFDGSSGIVFAGVAAIIAESGVKPGVDRIDLLLAGRGDSCTTAARTVQKQSRQLCGRLFFVPESGEKIADRSHRWGRSLPAIPKGNARRKTVSTPKYRPPKRIAFNLIRG